MKAFADRMHGNRRNSSNQQAFNRLIVIPLLALIVIACSSAAQAVNNMNSLVLSASLPNGSVGEAYNSVLSVSGGIAPYQFSVVSGSLPPGVALNSRTGAFTGSPSSAGNYSFAVMASDFPHADRGLREYAVTIIGTTGSIKVSVSPSVSTVSSGKTEQFTATVTGTANTAVTWSVSTGSINSKGLFTAPSVSKAAMATVTATSQANPKDFATATVVVDPALGQAPQITTSNLPQGLQGEVYSSSIGASGGTLPYHWSITSGSLPSGITMGSNGELSGTPSSAGTATFSVAVADASGKTGTGQFSLTTLAKSGYDGPAQLPLATVASAMSDSPAPGSVIHVASGGNLQTALNSAKCGDTIQLQAGATFTGQFTVPAKGCDASHWVIIRTSTPDTSLPAEGQRLTPCYAGVASLEGRPSYSCSSPKNVLAKIEMSSHGNGPIQLAHGANFYRFIGLEITRVNGTAGSAILISLQGTAEHIILDRSWLHGNLQDETSTGFSLNGGTYIAVVDSYFSDFHCISVTGTCTDAHAVSGGLGDTQDGPFKIQGNFLEASGEGVIFGGGAATMTPADIEIIGNHFWKPWQWMKGNVRFIGGPDGHPFVVKNHLEFKNAARVLVDGNLMENTWGGYSQTGFGILLTPKNQHTPTGDVCPICQVIDVTIRYAHIAHGAGGIQMATSISGNGGDGAAAKAGTRWSIHDVVMDDISTNYVGPGRLFEAANGWPSNPMNTVTINHITGFPDPNSGIMDVGNSLTNPSMYALVVTNSIMTTGAHPVWSVGGGVSSCAFYNVPLTSFNKCFSSYEFGHNVLVSTPTHFPPSSWPTGNLFAATVNDVGFVKYENANGGDYALVASSPYKNAGTDGRDMGADIAGLDTALAGVE